MFKDYGFCYQRNINLSVANKIIDKKKKKSSNPISLQHLLGCRCNEIQSKHNDSVETKCLIIFALFFFMVLLKIVEHENESKHTMVSSN